MNDNMHPPDPPPNACDSAAKPLEGGSALTPIGAAVPISSGIDEALARILGRVEARKTAKRAKQTERQPKRVTQTGGVPVAVKLPALMFYVGDWRKAPDVQSCGFAARGLWVELLFLMHESPRRGYLELNGKPVTPDQIARMTGGNALEVASLLRELEDAGVFSRDDRGVIFSRRMDREQHIRNVRSEAGKKGAAHGYKGGRPRKDTGSGCENLENPPPTANVDLAVSPDAGNPRVQNGKNGKPNGKITPFSSSSSSSDIAADAASEMESEKPKQTKLKAAPKEKKERPRNLLFDALVEVTGFDPDTAGACLGKVASALAAANPPYVPDDVREFGRRFLEFCPYARGQRTRPEPNELQKRIGLLRTAGRSPPSETPRIHRATDNPQNRPEAMQELFDPM